MLTWILGKKWTHLKIEFSGIIKHNECVKSKIPSLLYSNLFKITWQNWDPHTRKIYETIKLYKMQFVIWNPTAIVRRKLDQKKLSFVIPSIFLTINISRATTILQFARRTDKAKLALNRGTENPQVLWVYLWHILQHAKSYGWAMMNLEGFCADRLNSL